MNGRPELAHVARAENIHMHEQRVYLEERDTFLKTGLPVTAGNLFGGGRRKARTKEGQHRKVLVRIRISDARIYEERSPPGPRKQVARPQVAMHQSGTNPVGLKANAKTLQG